MSEKNETITATRSAKTDETKCSCQTECDCQTKNQENSDCHCQESQIFSDSAEQVCSGEGITEEELQEVYKNASVGKESIEILKSFTTDKRFKNLLLKQHREYASMAREIELYASKLGYSLEKTSMFAKGMMYFTTAINTLKDKSDSKLSEIMIQGINMGIISLTKLTNAMSDENRSCHVANALLDLLHKDLDEMKEFL